MSSLILCNKKRAKQPYEVSRIHCRIYTLEELCYYLSNNLYLIDYTIVNGKIVVKEGHLTGIDEEKAIYNCRQEVNKYLNH